MLPAGTYAITLAGVGYIAYVQQLGHYDRSFAVSLRSVTGRSITSVGTVTARVSFEILHSLRLATGPILVGIYGITFKPTRICPLPPLFARA